MHRIQRGAIDYAILIGYFFVLGIGWVLRRSVGREDFFISGRSIPAWITESVRASPTGTISGWATRRRCSAFC